MMKKNKKNIVNCQAAFEIYSNFSEQPNYFYLLARLINNTKSEFQRSRACKMLIDWGRDFENKTGIVRQKYFEWIPKTLQLLTNCYINKIDCLHAISLLFGLFFKQWSQIIPYVQQTLEKSEEYALTFIWLACFTFAEKLDPSNQDSFCNYVSKNFGQNLRHFKPNNMNEVTKIIEIVRLLNVQNENEYFKNNIEKWIQTFEQLLYNTSKQNTSFVLTQIVRLRIFFLNTQIGQKYWIQKFERFLILLNKQSNKLSIKCQLDVTMGKILMQNTLDKQILDIIKQKYSNIAYQIITNINRNTNIDYLFVNPPYHHIKTRLINHLFKTDLITSKNQLEFILKTSLQQSPSFLFADNNQQIVQCLTQLDLHIESSLILNLIKKLQIQHFRSKLTIETLILITKIVRSSIKQTVLSGQDLLRCIKLFVSVLVKKLNLEENNRFYIEIHRLMLIICLYNNFKDFKAIQLIFDWISQFEKYSSIFPTITMQILISLANKYQTRLFVSYSHKLQVILTGINVWIIRDKSLTNYILYVQMIIIFYLRMNWLLCVQYLQNLSNKSITTPNFILFLQYDIVFRKKFKLTQNQTNILQMLFKQKQLWCQQRIDIYLAYLELFVINVNNQQWYQFLISIDQILLDLFQDFIAKSKLHLLIITASKILPIIGSIKKITKLQSYKYIKKNSFQWLSISFHKTSILMMTNLFGCILSHSQNFQQDFIFLSTDNYLNDLFKGCDQFIGAQNRYNVQAAKTIAVFKIIRENNKFINYSIINTFNNIVKNINDWQNKDHTVIVKYFIDEKSDIILNQFLEFHQKTILLNVKTFINKFLSDSKIHNKIQLNQQQSQQDKNLEDIL